MSIQFSALFDSFTETYFPSKELLGRNEEPGGRATLQHNYVRKEYGSCRAVCPCIESEGAVGGA